MAETLIHTVSSLTQSIKQTLEMNFQYVWVKGEVTNFTRAASGHIYFSLKDDTAVLPCVWFKQSQKRLTFDVLTGEVFDIPLPSLADSLQNGKEMIFAGSLTVYPARGAYQLLIDTAEESGLGNLYKAFELLKNKLNVLGWFDEEHKKDLPINPQKVAVLTSPQGAVVHDFCRIASQYGLSSQICIYPVMVQGKEAPPTIINAIEKVNKEGWAEVIVLIRGGGSMEDLWAFNDENLAAAIFHSAIPIITGIGHQIDTTIADFVADKQVATPSHTVMHLWKERYLYAQEVDELELALSSLMKTKVQNLEIQLTLYQNKLALFSPQNKILLQEEQLNNLVYKLKQSQFFISENENKINTVALLLKPFIEKNITAYEQNIAQIALQLEALNPYSPLEKGYTLVHKVEENNDITLVRSSKEINSKSPLCLEFHDGKVFINIDNNL